jgi:hypothetical protein
MGRRVKGSNLEVKNTKNARRWTPEEDNRFRALAEAGRPVAVISERLKRSKKAIYARAIKLGVALKRPSICANRLGMERQT